jgi:AraC-like DNA-binding protein
MSQFYHRLSGCEGWEGAQTQLGESLSSIRGWRWSSWIAAATADLPHRCILEEQCCNPLLSLTYLSDQLDKNPAYLSMLYKSHTNTNILDRITYLRVEKAKALLAGSTLKTYEIARQVGYCEPSYFTKLFKRVVGQTRARFAPSIRRGGYEASHLAFWACGGADWGIFFLLSSRPAACCWFGTAGIFC